MLLDWFGILSTTVVARLASEGMPALVDGAVQLGPENAPNVQTSAAPRITLVPMGGVITKRVPSTPAFASQSLYKASITQPWVWTDVQSWRAWIAGVQYVSGAAESDLSANWDYTSAMLYVLIQSLTDLLEGSWKPTRYTWEDSRPANTKLGGFGRLITLDFEVAVPVLRYNLQAPDAIETGGLPLIPIPSHVTATVTPVGGSAGDALVIVTPNIS